MIYVEGFSLNIFISLFIGELKKKWKNKIYYKFNKRSVKIK